jgi:mannose-6-phosphate isomerase
MERIIPLYDQGELEKDEEDFWAARAAKSFCPDGKYDRGIFSIYFFNLVYLRKGEGVFQPPGLPHAYLEGRNIELMANSDNVLRAGLTTKHINVPELMKHLLFEATVPNIITQNSTQDKIYKTTADEFELHQVEAGEGKEITVATNTGEIFLLMEGKAMFSDGQQEIELEKGGSLFVIAGTRVDIGCHEEINLIRATVPSPAKNGAE